MVVPLDAAGTRPLAALVNVAYVVSESAISFVDPSLPVRVIVDPLLESV